MSGSTTFGFDENEYTLELGGLDCNVFVVDTTDGFVFLLSELTLLLNMTS
jgi:hypothetical protein